MLIISCWCVSGLLLMSMAQCCMQWTHLFLMLYWWWELKFRYCTLSVSLWYTDLLNPCAVQLICASRKTSWSSDFFTIVNSMGDLIEFTWSSSVYTSLWGQSIKVSFRCLYHMVGFSGDISIAISSKVFYV